MKIELKGEETIQTSRESLWNSVIDPEVLQRVIPGCKNMTEKSEGQYIILLELKIAAVSGSFQGDISLSEMDPPTSCLIHVSGNGSLGTGEGSAKIIIRPDEEKVAKISYEAKGNVGGLVAGVGQRILMGVSKHLVRQFFTALKKEFTIK